MDIENKRKEITALVDDVKIYSDQLKESKTLSLPEVNGFISKITQLHEKAYVLKYLVTVDHNYEKEEKREAKNLLNEEMAVEGFIEENKTPLEVISPLTQKDKHSEKTDEKKLEKSEKDIHVLKNIIQEKEDSEQENISFVPDISLSFREQVDEEDSPIEVKTEEKKNELKSESNQVPEQVEEPLKEEKETVDVKDVFPEAELKKEEPTDIESKKDEIPAVSIEEIERKSGLEAKPDLNEAFSGSSDDSLSRQLQKQPIKDLLSAIGLNERYLYANELFNGEMEDFRKAIQQLNDYGSGKEAKEFFNNSLREWYGWESDNELAKALYQLVERRYI